MRHIVVKGHNKSTSPVTIKQAYSPQLPKAIYKAIVTENGEISIEAAESSEHVSGNTYVLEMSDKKLHLLLQPGHITLSALIKALEDEGLI